MGNEPEFKWILTDRKGRCSGCRSQTEPGDRVLWSLIDKTHIWCEDCGVASGVLPLPPPVSNGKVLPTIRSEATASVQQHTSTTTTTPTPTVPSREEAIAKAHAENMDANANLVLRLAALTAAVLDLAEAERDRNKLLREAKA